MGKALARMVHFISLPGRPDPFVLSWDGIIAARVSTASCDTNSGVLLGVSCGRLQHTRTFFTNRYKTRVLRTTRSHATLLPEIGDHVRRLIVITFVVMLYFWTQERMMGIPLASIILLIINNAISDDA